MQTKAGPSTVLRAEHLFIGRRRTQATSFQEELMLSYFILTLLIPNALLAIYGRAVITKRTRSTCLIGSGGRRWKSSCLFVVK